MFRVKQAKIQRRREVGGERPGRTAQRIVEHVLGFPEGELRGIRAENSCFLSLSLEIQGNQGIFQ